MSAASSPATTRPRNPAGSSVPIKAGSALSGSSRASAPRCASTYAMTPGTTKMKSGNCFKRAANSVARRASWIDAAESVRWTMY